MGPGRLYRLHNLLGQLETPKKPRQFLYLGTPASLFRDCGLLYKLELVKVKLGRTDLSNVYTRKKYLSLGELGNRIKEYGNAEDDNQTTVLGRKTEEIRTILRKANGRGEECQKTQKIPVKVVASRLGRNSALKPVHI